MVLISPFHADTCRRVIGTDLRRDNATQRLVTSLATEGYKAERIMARVKPPSAQVADASSAELAAALVAAPPPTSVRRCMRRADKKQAPITPAIRTGDSRCAHGLAASAGSGYLAAITPRTSPWTVGSWATEPIKAMLASLDEDERDDLVFFVFQSALQEELRDVCSEIAIDSIHSFAKTVATSPDQLLSDLQHLALSRDWAMERLRKLRALLRESKELMRPLNLITVLGYFDIGRGSHKVGFPLGFAIVSSEKTAIVQAVLKILFPADRCRIHPRKYTRVMTDMALNLRNAVVGAGFRENALRQCTWHVSRALAKHAPKGPSQTIQLNMSISKFMVFGPRLSDAPHGAGKGSTVDDTDQVLADLASLKDSVDPHVLTCFQQQLASLLSRAEELKAAKPSSGISSVRHIQDLFSVPLGVADTDRFAARVSSHLESDETAPRAEEEPSEDAWSPPKSSCDGTVLLQALAFIPQLTSKTVLRPNALADLHLPFAVRSLDRCTRKMTFLERLVCNGFSLHDLLQHTVFGSPFAHGSLREAEEDLYQALLASLAEGVVDPSITRTEDLAFLSHELLGIAVGDRDGFGGVPADVLLSPPEHNPGGDQLTAILLLSVFRQHRGPMRVVVVSTLGDVQEITLKPSSDETSIFHLPDDDERPVRMETFRMLVLVGDCRRSIVAVTPLVEDSRVRRGFSTVESSTEASPWNSQVAFVFEQALACISEHRSTDLSACLRALKQLGDCWLQEVDFLNVNLPRLVLRTSFSLERGRMDTESLDEFDVPDIGEAESESTERRKRLRGEMLPEGLLEALPLKPSTKNPGLLSKMERGHSRREVKRGLRRTLALYHWWAQNDSKRIVLRLATAWPRAVWCFKHERYRAVWAFAQDRPRDYQPVGQIPKRATLCNLWLYSLRVVDVLAAARLAYTFSTGARERIWERLLPLQRLAWEYALVDRWVVAVRSLVAQRDNVGIQGLVRLAEFTRGMCCCLAWQEVFAPDCRRHLVENMLKHGCEGEWSAAFYTIPVHFATAGASERDVTRIFGPTTNNALESMHKDIHRLVDRRTGSLSHAVHKLPEVMLAIYETRAENFNGGTLRRRQYQRGARGLSDWIKHRTEEPVPEPSELEASVSEARRSEDDAIADPRVNEGSRWEAHQEREPIAEDAIEEGGALGGGDLDVEEGEAGWIAQGGLAQRAHQRADISEIVDFLHACIEERLECLTDVQYGALQRWMAAAHAAGQVVSRSARRRTQATLSSSNGSFDA